MAENSSSGGVSWGAGGDGSLSSLELVAPCLSVTVQGPVVQSIVSLMLL